MAEKRMPRTIADPWTVSAHHKEQQGQRRETHDTKKLQSAKDTHRRDDQKERSHGATVKAPLRRG